MVTRLLRWLQNFWNIFVAQLLAIVKLFLVAHFSALAEKLYQQDEIAGFFCGFLFRFFFVGTDIT
jgi:hypothetical protein